ncbi:MAG: SRPBCC family protein, partial [Candidatus Nanopelagicales bacterium]
VGGEFAAFTGIGKLGFIDPMQITKWNPPQEVSVAHLGKLVRGTGEMKVEKISENESDFIWSESLELPLGIIGFVGYKIIEPFFKIAIQKSLKKFALIVEKNS